MALTWPKRTQSAPKIQGFVPPIGCATLKNEIPQPWRGGNETKKPRSDPNHRALTKTLPSPGKNEEHSREHEW